MRVPITLVRSTLVGLCVAVGPLAPMLPSASARAAVRDDLPTEDELRQELAAIGLTPEILCIAGLTANETSAAVQSAVAAITEWWATLGPARSALMAKRAEVARLQAVIARGGALAEDHVLLGEARSALVSAESGLEDIVSEIWVEISQVFGGEQLEVVTRMLQNSTLPVPVEFRALDRSSAEWIQFRKAYSECQTNSEPSPEAEACVHAWRTSYDVVLAKTRMESNFPAVRAAFHAVIN